MRSGQFSRASHEYGASMSMVKPRNNDPGSHIPPELLNPHLGLTLEQQEELAQDVGDLFALYKYDRDN